MKVEPQNVRFKEMLLHKLWAVALLFSFFISSGFVGGTFQQQPRIVQTELVISPRPLSKKAFSYRYFTAVLNKKEYFNNSKNLIAFHNADTKRLLKSRLKVVLSFKNKNFSTDRQNASRNAQEEAAA